MTQNIDEIDMDGVKQVPVGAIEQSSIEVISKGVQSDFRNDSYWGASSMSKQEVAEAKTQACVQVSTANGARLVVNLPTKGSLHPKSTLAKFIAKYGGAPKVGIKVSTQLDANGFWQIVI